MWFSSNPWNEVQCEKGRACVMMIHGLVAEKLVHVGAEQHGSVLACTA
jgi:hypothetical protein